MLASTGPATPFFLMHSMAMLWDGGAAGCCGLYRHLSLVEMCTSVLGDKLRAFASAPGGSIVSMAQTVQRLAVAKRAATSCSDDELGLAYQSLRVGK